MNFTEKMQKCQEYIEGLEEERRKILVFQRELPLCLELVNHAIDACKKQLSVTTTTTEYFNGQSECTEQTSSESPVFEEFIPIKRASSCNDEDDEEQSHKSKSNGDTDKNSEKLGKKSDWLRSVQLWNQTSDQPIKEVPLKRKKKIIGLSELSGYNSYYLSVLMFLFNFPPVSQQPKRG